jgi:hypothetical protein
MEIINNYDKETPWIDAWIRWDRNSKEAFDEYQDDDDDDDDDDEEDDRVPPTATFSFNYKLPPRKKCCSPSCNGTNFTLKLKGFPSESEQIWNSTGLTMWPSSYYLCEYLLDNSQKLLSLNITDFETKSTTATTTSSTTATKPGTLAPIRVIELGSGLGRCGLLLHHLLMRSTENNNNCDSDCEFSGTCTTINKTSIRNSHVYLTDGDTDTLAQLRANVIDNIDFDDDDDDNEKEIRKKERSLSLSLSLSPSETETETGAPIEDQNRNHVHHHRNHGISCHQLLWGKQSTRAFYERHFLKPATTPIVDGTSSNQLTIGETVGGVDIVFGSDLIYSPRGIQPLFETVSILLQQNRCGDSDDNCSTTTTTTTTNTPIFLMAHSDRREGSSVTVDMILEGAKAVALNVEILQEVQGEGIYIIAFKRTP